MGPPVALQSRLELGKVDANPSTTQVVEFREQIALADDAGGVNRDRMWALELFWNKSGNIRGQRSQLDRI
jgi:hypothetical protein